MTPDPKLTAWMGRNRRATRYELRARPGGVVGTWEREDDGDAILTQIVEASEADAQDRPGRVVYELSACMPSGRVIGSTSWVMHGREDDGGFSDDPTLANALRNNQRHLEASQKLLHTALAGAMEQAQEVIRGQQQRIRELEARELEVMKLREDLLQAAHERDMEIAKERAAAALAAEALAEVKPAIPVVLGAVANRLLPGVMPSPAVPDVLEGFVASITDDQLSRIVEHLTPPQRVALGKVWQDAIAKMQAREARKSSNTSNGAAAPTE